MDTDQAKRIAELEKALEEHEAITATAIKITRQMAFGEAAKMLLRLAKSAQPMGLAEAAKVINDMAREGDAPPSS